MTNGIGRVGWRNFVSAPTNNPLWNNLVAYYTGDNTPNDAKGTANGTLINGATYSTGKINNGFSFDGINDYANFGNNLDFNGSTPFSFNFWVSPTAATANAVFFSKYDGTKGYLIRKSANGNYVNIAIVSSGSSYISVSSNSIVIPSNSYNMITVTYNGTPNISGIKIYVNATSDTLTALYQAFTTSASNTSNFLMGSLATNANFYNGVIDEVAVWNRVITSTEVTELYNSGAGKQYVAPTYTTRTTAFATATGITDTTILNALNTFDTGLISNGLATKMKAVYPFVGTTATTQKFNFMDARDLNAAFRLQFNGGITFTSNGILFGGDNGFANTFVQPSTVLSLNDTHISLYSRTNNSSQVFDIQCTATPSLDIAMWGGTTFYNVNQALNYSTYSDGSTLGFRLINRTSSVSEKLFKNNSLVATVTNASTSLSPGVIDIGRYYFGGYYSNRNYAFISIGSGLTDAEALTFYNLVQAMQTSLSRAV